MGRHALPSSLRSEELVSAHQRDDQVTKKKKTCGVHLLLVRPPDQRVETKRALGVT